MLCFSGFELYSRWVPLLYRYKNISANLTYVYLVAFYAFISKFQRI